MKENVYEVGGFSFTDEELAKQAKNELEGAKYIRGQLDHQKPEVMLKMYHRLLQERIFVTPVGISFLKEIQNSLRANPAVLNTEIQGIPVDMIQKEAKNGQKQSGIEESEHKQIRQTSPVKEKNVDYKSRYRMLIGVSVVLAIVVLAMFAITATTNSPTILNYENEIINKYEAWSQQLEAKEQELKEREAALMNGQE